VKGDLAMETVSFASADCRTDSDSSANESGFADQRLSTGKLFVIDVFTPAQIAEIVASLHLVIDEHGPNGFAYFVRQGERVKIGYTKDLKQRMKTLRVSHGSDCELLAYRDGGRDREANYHFQFAAHHIKGEWSHAHPDILDEAKRLKLTLSPTPTDARLLGCVAGKSGVAGGFGTMIGEN
jgi:hypothetical protein